MTNTTIYNAQLAPTVVTLTSTLTRLGVTLFVSTADWNVAHRTGTSLLFKGWPPATAMPQGWITDDTSGCFVKSRHWSKHSSGAGRGLAEGVSPRGCLAVAHPGRALTAVCHKWSAEKVKTLGIKGPTCTAFQVRHTQWRYAHCKPSSPVMGNVLVMKPYHSSRDDVHPQMQQCATKVHGCIVLTPTVLITLPAAAGGTTKAAGLHIARTFHFMPRPRFCRNATLIVHESGIVTALLHKHTV